MWGRELRAGLVFVLVSLLVGAGIRAWRRDHEVRFQEVVEALVEQDLAAAERAAGSALPGIARTGLGAAGGAREGEAPGGPAAGGEVHRSRAAVPAAPLRPGALDVDRASVPEWVRLPGIGPSLAARIVADRSARGPFGGPEGLLRVPGIGPKTLAKIRLFLATGADSPATPPR